MGQAQSHEGPYHFTANDDVPHPLSHKTNYIRTTKYTLLTFIPVNLFTQFRRFYNLYFLLGAILSAIPGLSPVSPITQITPLVLVLGVTAIKDAVEDFGRHRSDTRANNVEFQVVTKGQSMVVKSKDIRPGDLIYIEKNQQFPCDIIILSSSHEEGLAYIETAELDGETNLKKRQALPATLTINSKEQFVQFKASVECDPPDALLYEYRGKLKLGDQTLALNPEQLLLRGSILRNTNSIFGIVCYVGPETKIMKNLKSASLKFSSLEHRLNITVLSIFVINAIYILVSALASGSWQAQHREAWYIDWDITGARVGLYHASSYYILYTYLIPISLFVTIEISRLVQTLYMFWDTGMSSSSGVPMRPRNSNLNEDLGRLDHIFSDKTGTLTQNIMNLKHWFVNGRIIDEDGQGEITKFASGELGEQGEKELFLNFLRAVSVCHTVVPSYDEKTDELIYEGDSPDEAALLDALRKNEVTFTSRSLRSVVVKFFGEALSFEVLQVIEFSSARKRMSLIVKTPEGTIEMYCKGADNVILERSQTKDEEATMLLNTAITEFSKQGLRTLLVAHKTLTEKEYEIFRVAYHEAEVSDEHNWKERLEEVANQIEQNLTVLGATAVEDKLQEEVAETIEYLLKCGINVWMLTGDKLETAISIGKSTRFLSEEMELLTIDTESSASTGEKFDSYLQQFGRKHTHGHEEGTEMKSSTSPKALIITGKALTFALQEHSEKFLALSDIATSVICCRVSPLQKSQVVKLVKKQRKKICLSIGDGANDVSMIQVANVGVGIIGLEGTQAVRASDYAFKEFRALKRLVSVHGRYSYIRMSKLILFSFYKNLVFIIPQFWAGIYMAWSAVSTYHELVLTFYNLVFTALPPFLLAFLEKDIDISTINLYPQAYKTIKNDDSFNPKLIALWGLDSLYQGTVLYFFLILQYGEGINTPDGREFGGYFLTSASMAFFVLTTVLIKWAFYINHWHWPYSFFGFLSYAVFVGFMFIFSSEAYVSYDETTTDLGLVSLLLSAATFYLSLVLAVTAALLPELTYYYFNLVVYPKDYQILMEQEVLEKNKNLVRVETQEKSLANGA